MDSRKVAKVIVFLNRVAEHEPPRFSGIRNYPALVGDGISSAIDTLLAEGFSIPSDVRDSALKLASLCGVEGKYIEAREAWKEFGKKWKEWIK